MTFAAGPKRRARRTQRCVCARRIVPCTEVVCAGFTLLEIILALALLCLLTGLAVLNFAGWVGSSELPEGARAFETVLRMARAEAANLGRRLRLGFDAEAGTPMVLWEPEPLGEPGTFVEYTACLWKDRIPSETIRVVRCQLIGESAYRTLNTIRAGSERTEDVLQEITFNPDGSSDSAVINLTAATGSDDRCAVIELDGLTGTITTTFVSGQDAQER